MPRNVAGALALSFCSLLLIPSCFTIQEDILNLERQNAALSSRVHKLEKSMEGTNVKSIHESQAEVVAELDEVRGELQSLSGNVEDNKHLIRHFIERDTTGQDAMNARLGELEARIGELQKYLQLEPLPKPNETGLEKWPNETTKLGPQPPDHEELASPEERLYESTLASYREGKYREAIAGFKDFLNSYPKSKLADNAQFWIGESYMSLAEYEQAILAYQEVIKNYPEGNKVPSAMLKQALAFYEIKDATSSNLLLKKIIKKYPGSAEAKIAEAKLKKMK